MRPDTRHFGGLRAIFQLTHPILGAASMRCSLPGRVIFQLTHPVWKCSGVANLPQIMQAPFQLTHPMRGTTSSPPSLRCPCFISTRAPMMGATTRKSGRNTNQSNFNSRTRTGCDSGPIHLSHNRSISTHAPRDGCDCSGCWTSLGRVSISIPALRIEGYQTPWTRL